MTAGEWSGSGQGREDREVGGSRERAHPAELSSVAAIDMSADAPLDVRLNVFVRALAAARERQRERPDDLHKHFEPEYRHARDSLAAAMQWTIDGARSEDRLDSPQIMAAIARASAHLKSDAVGRIAEESLATLLRRVKDAVASADTRTLDKLAVAHCSNTALGELVDVVDGQVHTDQFLARIFVDFLSVTGESRTLSGSDVLAGHPVVDLVARRVLTIEDVQRRCVRDLPSFNWGEALGLVIDRTSGAFRQDTPPGATYATLLQGAQDFYAQRGVEDIQSVVGTALHRTAQQLGLVDRRGMASDLGDLDLLDPSVARRWAERLGDLAESRALKGDVVKLVVATGVKLNRLLDERGVEVAPAIAAFYLPEYRETWDSDGKRLLNGLARSTLRKLVESGVGLDDESVARLVPMIYWVDHAGMRQVYEDIASEFASIEPLTRVRGVNWTPTRDLATPAAEVVRGVARSNEGNWAATFERLLVLMDPAELATYLEYATLNRHYQLRWLKSATDGTNLARSDKPSASVTPVSEDLARDLLGRLAGNPFDQGRALAFYIAWQDVAGDDWRRDAVAAVPLIVDTITPMALESQLEFLRGIEHYFEGRDSDPLKAFAIVALVAAACRLEDAGELAATELLMSVTSFWRETMVNPNAPRELVDSLYRLGAIGRPEADWLVLPLLTRDTVAEPIKSGILLSYVERQRAIVAYEYFVTSYGPEPLSRRTSRELRAVFAGAALDSVANSTAPTAEPSLVAAFGERVATGDAPDIELARRLARGLLSFGQLLIPTDIHAVLFYRTGVESLVGALGEMSELPGDHQLASQLLGWARLRGLGTRRLQ